jgi:hypothetical protein
MSDFYSTFAYSRAADYNSGSGTLPIPVGVRKLFFVSQGAGGGGGFGYTQNCDAGGGGGSGAFISLYYQIDEAHRGGYITYSVGTGGAGGVTYQETDYYGNPSFIQGAFPGSLGTNSIIKYYNSSNVLQFWITAGGGGGGGVGQAGSNGYTGAPRGTFGIPLIDFIATGSYTLQHLDNGGYGGGVFDYTGGTGGGSWYYYRYVNSSVSDINGYSASGCAGPGYGPNGGGRGGGRSYCDPGGGIGYSASSGVDYAGAGGGGNGCGADVSKPAGNGNNGRIQILY